MLSQNFPADVAQRILSNRSCPGIMVFSLQGKLLWADRRAWELSERRCSIPESLEIATLLKDMSEMVKVRPAAKDWDDFHPQRVMLNTKKLVSACAFAVPTLDSDEEWRIVLLVEEIGRSQETAAEQAANIFRFTNRESVVIRHLLRGWSNKAIAHEMNVTEQTVKEHLARIMQKTKSTSRSELLIRVLCL